VTDEFGLKYWLGDNIDCGKRQVLTYLSLSGRHWIGGKRGEINVGDEHVLMRTENIFCNFAKQRRFSYTQQEIGSFLFCFSFLDSAIGL
jgi:hypothetical protein